MHEYMREPVFRSALAPYLHQFVEEKRVLGCRYTSQARQVGAFDRFLASQGATSPDLEKSLIGPAPI